MGGTLDGCRRPGEPDGVLRHDVEKNVGVDQHRHRSIAAGQRHDRLRAHRDVAASLQMSDKTSTATTVFTGFGTNDAHDLAIELELHLRLWQQASPFADFGRDGHLALM